MIEKQIELNIEPYVVDVVETLQNAGFESYLVGGAIRDLLMQRIPKDFDISTAATPEEVRNVFGRRRARIIGRRFQLVHVRCGSEILEVSTFRRAPRPEDQQPLTPSARRIAQQEMGDKVIFSDNDFGTSEEDAMRRDFTVNALFYDPVAELLRDCTEQGLGDIEAGVVRAIGDPAVRFQEDPVRMLRALKLVGQYGFQLEPETEKALRDNVGMLELTSPSRLSLELEKILQSAYAGLILKALNDFGLMHYFLPGFAHADPALWAQSLELLAERGKRVRAGMYRISASLAVSCLALPFANAAHQNCRSWAEPDLRKLVLKLFAPLTVGKNLNAAACRTLRLQPLLNRLYRPGKLMNLHGFLHAFELLKIRSGSGVLAPEENLIAGWRDAFAGRKEGGALTENAPAKRRRRRRRRPRRPAAPVPVSEKTEKQG